MNLLGGFLHRLVGFVGSLFEAALFGGLLFRLGRGRFGKLATNFALFGFGGQGLDHFGVEGLIGLWFVQFRRDLLRATPLNGHRRGVRNRLLGLTHGFLGSRVGLDFGLGLRFGFGRGRLGLHHNNGCFALLGFGGQGLDHFGVECLVGLRFVQFSGDLFQATALSGHGRGVCHRLLGLTHGLFGRGIGLGFGLGLGLGFGSGGLGLHHNNGCFALLGFGGQGLDHLGVECLAGLRFV